MGMNNHRCRVLFHTLVFLAVISLDCRGQHDSLFLQGNRYYQNNRFDLAIEAYAKAIDAGNISPELLYNLGNAYYKNGNLPHAILYYEKARLLNPQDEDINKNLAIANVRVVDKTDVIPEIFLKRWMRNFILLFPSNIWALASIFAFALSLLFFLLYILASGRRMKSLGFFPAVFLLLISIITLWSSLKRIETIKGSRAAIIMDASVTVKSSPAIDGNNLFMLHEGTKVMIMDSLDNWKEIRIPDGNKGWIESKSVQPV
jgi:tetratricopeptide (TPR) repeat protein